MMTAAKGKILTAFEAGLTLAHSGTMAAMADGTDGDGNSASLLYALPQSCINEYKERPFP